MFIYVAFKMIFLAFRAYVDCEWMYVPYTVEQLGGETGN